jgi:hypothetical protein
MSKVSLTEDHKQKLIQMTEFIMYDYDVGINDFNEVFYQHKQNPEKQGEIYWLEHVIYHLAKKILNRDDSAILQFHVSCLTTIFNESNPFHPINYLHERYMRNKVAKEKQFKLDL